MTANVSISCKYKTSCSKTSIIPAQSSGTIINGSLVFPNQIILSSGIFYINATAPDMKMASSATNQITYYVSNLTLTPRKNSLSVYVSDIIDILIYADDNTPYNPSCNLIITNQSNNQLANTNITNGSGSVTIFMRSVGNTIINGIVMYQTQHQ